MALAIFYGSLKIVSFISEQEGNPLTSREEKKRKLSILFSSRREEKRMERFRTPHENFHQTFRTHEKRMERFRTPYEIFHQTFRTHEITWT